MQTGNRLTTALHNIPFLGYTLAKRDDHHKGCKGNQVLSEFLNTRTKTTTGNPSTLPLNPKHYKICHPGK